MAYLHGLTEKTGIASADELFIADSTDSFTEKRVTYARLLQSPTFVTPVLGAATGTSLVLSGAATAASFNGLAISSSTGTLTIANGKTLEVNNSIALTGTDSTEMTFPSTDADIARTDAAQTFAGTQTFSGEVVMSNGLTLSGSLSLNLDITSSAGAIKVSGSSLSKGVGYTTGAGGTATEVAGAVTVTKICGTITTSSLSNAAGAEYVITVTASGLNSADVPVVAIKAYSGTGTPVAVVTAVATNSFTITVTNLHSADPLSNTMTINYAIFKSSAA